MKIGIDCHNLEGQRTGVGRYLWNLLKEWRGDQETLHIFSDRKIYVKFLLYFKNEIPGDIRELLSETESNPPPALGGRRVSWNVQNLNCESNALFKHWILPRAAARDKVDVLFCPDYVLPMYTLATRSCSKCIKTVVTIHDIIYEARSEEYSWPSWADKILLKWASKQSAKTADIIFAPSEFTKSEILKYYKVNPEKVVVTPLAPDPVFCPIPAFCRDRANQVWDNIAKKYNIAYKRYVFFIGSIFNRRFLPQKIQGFTQFAESHSDFSFLIIGKNDTKPYHDIGALASTANRALGRGAVIWKEYASDEELVYLYNGAFVTLWFSSYEGFGLPVLESMACGTPVITVRAGSLPEVGGDAALYVDNLQNPEEISIALTRLVRDNVYYGRLVEMGLSQCAKLSWKKCALQTIDRILRLV